MENNSDRMGFALIALSVVAFVLLAVNGPLKSTVDGFFNGFKNWQTQTVNGISESNKQDVIHTAYSWSTDGTDRFTTTKPNLNLLDGTRDFSGNWANLDDWITDGTYKGLAVNKKTKKSVGMYKIFTAPKDGTYTFSIYIKSSGNDMVLRWVNKNWVDISCDDFGSNFDWKRDSYTIKLKAGDIFHIRYELLSDEANSEISVAGYKLEEAATATPWMPNASEVKPSDQPKYIGTYTDKNESASQDPSKYTWKLNPDYHE